MIDIAPILKIAPIFIAALVSPGPDFMLVSATAMSRGRLAGLLAACGIAAGTTVYTSLCVFGLGGIFAELRELTIAVKIAGGVYLMYLGFWLWKASFETAVMCLRLNPARSVILLCLVS